MGACCGASYLTIGEEYLRRNLDDLNLWETTFKDLKTKLLKNSSSDLIEKKQLKSVLFGNSLTDIQNMMFDYILTHLDDSTSVYWVLFYLIPFISYSESSAENFINVVLQFKKEATLEEFRQYLKKFYEFSLISTTKKVEEFIKAGQIENKQIIITDLDKYLNEISNNENIEKEITKFIDLLKEHKKKRIDDVHIIAVAKERLYFKYSELRIHFINVYEYQ